MIKLSLPDNLNYCTLYIARHGETDWNVKRIIQGHKDTHLTKKGKLQAKNLAKQLEKLQFDAIFSSDLLQAKHTAEIIALQHKLTVTGTKLLRERSLGHFEGKPRKFYDYELKDLLEKFETLGDEEQHRFKLAPDIESDEEISSRLIPFIRELSLGYIGKNVLIITHGAIIRTLLVHLGYARRNQLKYGSIGNAAYIKLLSDGTDFFIEETSGVNLV